MPIYREDITDSIKTAFPLVVNENVIIFAKKNKFDRQIDNTSDFNKLALDIRRIDNASDFNRSDRKS